MGGNNYQVNHSGNDITTRFNKFRNSLSDFFRSKNTNTNQGTARKESKREKKDPPKEDKNKDDKSENPQETHAQLDACPTEPAGPMFGCRLEEGLDEATGVSRFVVWCVEAVQATGDGLDTDAIYRASGNRRKVLDIMETPEGDMQAMLKSELNIHVLTGALKTFLRDLTEPLLTIEDCSTYFQDDTRSKEEQCQQFRQNVIVHLSPAKRATLKFILDHLIEVVSHESSNKMSARSVAVVFAPNIIRCLDDGNESEQQIAVTEFLLANCEALFDTTVASVEPSSGVVDTAEEEIVTTSQTTDNQIHNVQKTCL